MEGKEESKKEKRRMEEKEEKKIKIGGGEKKKKQQQPEEEEGFIQFQLQKMTRKRSSHQDHLNPHAPKKKLKHQHPTTCPKLQRCKNPPNDKCKNDIGKENFGFASLNLDVMELIFNRLNDTVTRIRFSAVCRSWRWVAQHCCTPHQFPWLLLDYDECKGDYFFFSLSDGMAHTLHIPEARGMIICGAFEGWLVMQSPSRAKRRKFFLIDPLSKAKIHLPVTATAINGTVNQQTVPVPALFAVYLSSAPISNDGANNNNCLAVGISIKNNLYYCRLGDQSWTQQDFIEAQDFKFEEIIFHNGSVIAVDRWAWGMVQILELVLESDHLRAKIHSVPLPVFGDPNDEDSVHEFDSFRNLIEWRGELYFVFHEIRGRKGETVALHVFKLDKLEPRWNLAKVQNIGDGAIFLLGDVPKCFSVKDYPPSLNLKGNCIYHMSYLSRSTNIFRIEDGKWEPFPSLSSVQTEEVPFMWYAPKIRY